MSSQNSWHQRFTEYLSYKGYSPTKAEVMAVYIKNDMQSHQLLEEMRTLSTTQRMRQLVDLIDEAISRAALDNAELKNKIIKLYENRDKLIEKLDKLL